ncbi:hypothetical protein LCGC14_0603180 [marine sediment metagenome]|uniref:Uncharacterized protein n=1 Tax=marine sediment metagenome TaxID=412755 RepID=A0A0F9UIF8_9ZZZZ
MMKMVSKKRIAEAYRFYVYGEPGNTKESINRYKILRERFRMILESPNLRSIQIAMGYDGLPFQFTIEKINDEDFNEFIANSTSGKRRKEIYNKYNE